VRLAIVPFDQQQVIGFAFDFGGYDTHVLALSFSGFVDLQIASTLLQTVVAYHWQPTRVRLAVQFVIAFLSECRRVVVLIGLQFL
jgi:hypothetical protein